jgi:hypothetical protein
VLDKRLWILDLRFASAKSSSVVLMSADMITFDFLASATPKSCLTTGCWCCFARTAYGKVDFEDILVRDKIMLRRYPRHELAGMELFVQREARIERPREDFPNLYILIQTINFWRFSNLVGKIVSSCHGYTRHR